MLPNATIRIWPEDALKSFEGLMNIFGIYPDNLFGVRSFENHPWVGLDITFPFPELGIGRIYKCLTHPRGFLMFDVVFPEPVPPIGRNLGNLHVDLVDQKSYHHNHRRFSAFELIELVGMEEPNEVV